MKTIDRKEIYEISPVSRTKTFLIMTNKKFKFPIPIKIINERTFIYNRSDVLKFFNDNDLKKIKVLHNPAVEKEKKRPEICETFDNKMAVAWLSGNTREYRGI